jgi:hypothetical protein
MMLKLSRNQVADIREAIEKDNKRIDDERIYGDITAKRAKNLTPVALASQYKVSVNQIRYITKEL